MQNLFFGIHQHVGALCALGMWNGTTIWEATSNMPGMVAKMLDMATPA